jgi:NAD(P)-dependent dehydrogenase (short-subunit alcohol dehydrogenase family)
MAFGIGCTRRRLDMGRLDGKRIFITGAGSGIGRAAATLFAREGARVAVAEIDPAAGEETARLVGDAGGEALALEVDVREPDSVEGAIADTVAAFGGLDVVYNNAGGSTLADGPVTEAPLEEFWRAISLDLFGTFLGCRFGIPRLVEAGGGSVINTASNVALMGFPGRDCYTATKGGIAAMTRSMAVEYAAQGVRVNAVAPATTRTPRVMHMLENNAGISSVTGRQLLGIVEPEEIAYMALYLASDESRRTTGQILPVDSGVTIS